MTDPDRPSPTEELQKRVKAAQDRNSGALRDKGSISSNVGTGMGVGVKVGVDLVVGVGAAIGWGLDWWLETKPILLVIFLIFGFIAGLMNVVRTANQSIKLSGADSEK